MKKIAIVTWKMALGGTEKSLISMLEAIPKENYHVTLFIMDPGGELDSEIPKHIKVEYLHRYETTASNQIKSYLQHGKLLKALKVSYFAYQSSRSRTKFDWEKNHSRVLPKTKESFDMAIAYHVPTSFSVLYAMNNISAAFKVAWIHNDVEYEKDISLYRDYYLKYDRIFCVSKQSKDKFVNVFPELKNQTSVFYNILDVIKMYELAEKEVDFNDPSFNGIKLLTVGRLDGAKGYDLIPPILQRLVSEGLDVKWYCVGEGDYRGKVEELIKTYHLQDKLILLGMKLNPFPYYKQCDIYVQPSRNEGFCNTLSEAKVFYKPIVTTDFVGAKEQISHGKTGLMVKYNEDELFHAIKELCLNQKLCQTLTENLKVDFSLNKTDISKLLSIIA
ncbi:glycosyltransferase [Pullulanibacillus sp. KACC 23026]|uniref:glycosyltransferase n=1 Tax=Pullulanibacillus sp. KACC 23026 TaxID=3028315 RepID=UPI0023B1356E|nr:glycosyltransferase [Pullulanibacillus sp. KACC 23026]WEG11503.1 glycosyltransferase [Pullulanibacillus sp. KACC 23026]